MEHPSPEMSQIGRRTVAQPAQDRGLLDPSRWRTQDTVDIAPDLHRLGIEQFAEKGSIDRAVAYDGLLVRVLGCHALRDDGRCGEYRTRPLFCRTYPEVPLTRRPMVLKGCGYGFERRDGRPEVPEVELVQIGRRIPDGGQSSSSTDSSFG